MGDQLDLAGQREVGLRGHRAVDVRLRRSVSGRIIGFGEAIESRFSLSKHR